MKLNSLKDLKAIRKELAPEPEAKQGQNQPRKHSVSLRSKEEEHARNEGLVKGQKVRMMDTSDTATIIGFGKDFYELDLDGLVIRAVRSEFIPIDPEQDRKMLSAVPSRVSGKAERKTVTESGDLVIDLHLERIPGNEGVPEWAALEFQMNYFRQTLRQHLRHRGKRIVFVHGVGDGTLASAIRKELDEVYALSCTYTFGPMGTTNVIIR